jgi:hypothetical protein
LVPPADETTPSDSPVHLAKVPAAGQQKSAPKFIPGTPP